MTEQIARVTYIQLRCSEYLCRVALAFSLQPVGFLHHSMKRRCSSDRRFSCWRAGANNNAASVHTADTGGWTWLVT